jgi:plastocyanin
MKRLLRISAGALFAALAIAACSEESTPPPSNPGINTGGNSTETTSSAPTTGGNGGGGETTGGNGGGGQAADSGTINIENFQYGEPLSVAPGAQITVTNKDSAPHDAVADDGSFRTEVLGQNESGTFTAPTAPGTYKFSCTLHGNMTSIGTLVVQG